MKQKFRRYMAGFLAILTMFTTLFTNGTTAFAASSTVALDTSNSKILSSIPYCSKYFLTLSMAISTTSFCIFQLFIIQLF